MEKCPECNKYTLEFVPGRGRQPKARCIQCDFSSKVENEKEYKKSYVLVERNWDNYCAKTPEFVRKIRGHITLEAAIKHS